MLNILHRKGKVRRSLKRRAYFYKAVVSRQQVASHAISGLVDRLFGGSAENLVMSLLETKHLTPQKLAKLNEVIKASSQEEGQEEGREEGNEEGKEEGGEP